MFHQFFQIFPLLLSCCKKLLSDTAEVVLLVGDWCLTEFDNFFWILCEMCQVNLMYWHVILIFCDVR